MGVSLESRAVIILNQIMVIIKSWCLVTKNESYKFKCIHIYFLLVKYGANMLIIKMLIIIIIIKSLFHS